jgi:protein-disulfide isomerase
MMRLLLLLIPSLMLLGQAPVHKVSAAKAAPAVTNYKESGSASAPITLEVYTDYECPHCRNFYNEILPSLTKDFIATGKVRLIHRDFPLPMHQFAKLAARYANAAGQLGLYDVVSSQIFRTQADWSQNGNIDGAVARVVPPAEMQKIREMVKSDSHLDDTVAADVAQGNRDHLTETPFLVIVMHGTRTTIGGSLPYGVLKAYLDEKLAKG